MSAYYNEVDPYAAQWLRNLIADGHIAAGAVDERSIKDVRPDDLKGFAQCHFFAGIAGWSLALRLAGWPDDRPVWTGSCPCQPFSSAGKRAGGSDERHLWPCWFGLIRECRPAVVFGEQVAAAVGWGWLDAVCADLEAQAYATGAVVLGAHSVGAPHIRQRLWWVAVSDGRHEPQVGTRDGAFGEQRQTQRGRAVQFAGTGAAGGNGSVADDAGPRRDELALGPTPALHRQALQSRRLRDAGLVADAESRDGGLLLQPGGSRPEGPELVGCREASPHGLGGADEPRSQGRRDIAGEYPGERTARPTGAWDDPVWLPCTDGKQRPTQPGLFPLAHGVPARVGRLRAYGNAIVPQVAAEFIAAVMDPS